MRLGATVLLLLLSLPAGATSLSLRSTETVAPGVTVETYRASSPSTTVYVARVDLCADGVYLHATRATDDTETTGSWAGGEEVALATNGDFYRTGPLRVYGDAVGDGLRWPAASTGLDPAYAGEWYADHYGWIAFVQDGAVYTHTGWVKDNAAEFGTLGGWAPTTVNPDPPAGTIALVSGFPELVVEGRVMTCADPTASDCFPDRSDMRERHPRTAMGLTEDGGTLLLAVADGRTSDDAGFYGSELAWVMGQLGAWEAFNLDGGGSSQLWADGYVNDYDGNNSGGGARGVANHWGVFAGAVDFLPDRPGHCPSAPPCGVVPADGGVVDDGDACFRGFGPPVYWRTESGVGEGGSLHWTNEWGDDVPYNWAWWRLELEEAGTYRVEVSTDATWSVHDDVHYDVRAAGVTTSLRVDPTGGGWHALGDYRFAAGGEQWVAVFDDAGGSVASSQHVVADAVRLTRLDPDSGDSGSGDSGAGDSGAGDSGSGDSGAGDSGAGDSGSGDSGSGDSGHGAEVVGGTDGCGCGVLPTRAAPSSGAAAAAPWRVGLGAATLAAAALARRRRR